MGRLWFGSAMFAGKVVLAWIGANRVGTGNIKKKRVLMKKWPSLTELLLGYTIAFLIAWVLLSFAESILVFILK